MKDHRMKKFPKFLFIIVPIILLIPLAVMLLWNSLLPVLFGFKTITYVQALGLFILFRLLNGHIGPRSWGGRPNRFKMAFMKEKWNSLSEEEKIQWRDHMNKGEMGRHTPGF